MAEGTILTALQPVLFCYQPLEIASLHAHPCPQLAFFLVLTHLMWPAFASNGVQCSKCFVFTLSLHYLTEYLVASAEMESLLCRQAACSIEPQG